MGTLPPSPAQLSLILIPIVLADLPNLLREAQHHCLAYLITSLNMSSGDYSHIFESQYAAFIIWTIFILAFIIVPFLYIPLKFLIGRIYRRCRCFAFIRGLRQDGNDVDFDGRPVYSVWDVDYVHLSHSKKNQICQLRAREISKYLTPYSLDLSTENMISRQHDNDGHDQDEQYHQEECNASQETLDEANQSRATTNYDIEASGESSTERSSSEEAKYTHICIPLPGYNKDGMRKPKKKPTANSGPKNKRVFGVALIRRESNDANKQTKELSESDVEDDATLVKDDTQQKNDRREVPIFCAVCLGEYETTDRVCWSSNTACTHVFHHDCIFQWLKASGKRASKQQRFSENPTVKQVMNFAMECPCCRQSFIDKSVDVCVDGDEENV